MQEVPVLNCDTIKSDKVRCEGLVLQWLFAKLLVHGLDAWLGLEDSHFSRSPCAD